MNSPELDTVLTLVNKGRVALGSRPLDALPKGMPRESCRCVIAAAFPGSVVDGIMIASTNEYDTEAPKKLAAAWGLPPPLERSYWTRLPSEITEFILAFDAGKYPELINCKLRREDFEVIYDYASSSFRWRHKLSRLRSKEFPFSFDTQEDLNTFFERAGI